MKNIFTIAVFIAGTVLGGDVFKDTFDVENNAGLNDGLDSRQDGSVAPVNYGVYSTAGESSVCTESGALRVNVEKPGFVRVVPEMNLADVLKGGDFEISYSVIGGINYADIIHGSYQTTVALGQKSIVQHQAGIGNPYFALGVSIAGNGRVNVFCGGTKLHHQIPAEAFMIGMQNQVRLSVSGHGFSKGEKASFTLFVNDAEVCSGEFEWKSSNDLYLGIQADSRTAMFDDLMIVE